MRIHKPYDEGDAMTDPNIAPSFLFSDGRGNWEVWLRIASQHVQHVLNDPRFCRPEEALQRCSQSMGFIIKTTMWFDVLASAMTQQVPCFLQMHCRIFNNAFIGDPLTRGAGGKETTTPMLLVMGCENKVVLAIVETPRVLEGEHAPPQVPLIPLLARAARLVSRRHASRRTLP